MKIWIEFPDSTRFAKPDLFYTPVYFANEAIHASLQFDDEWQQQYKLSDLTAQVVLSGRASLGYLSMGSHPVNALDTRYALPTAGFRTIYKLDMLEIPQTIHLEDDQNQYPFTFILPTSTLTQLQQLASSMRVVSADASCTMDALRVMSPALTVSVNYVLSASVQPPGRPKTEMHQEVRIFVGLSGEQVPFMSPDFLAGNPLASIVTTQIIPLIRMSRRRASIPLIRRMSRSSSSSSAVQDDPYLIIDAAPPKPFTFRRADDAAATKVVLTLTYHRSPDGTDEDDDSAPPTMVASVQWMMKSLTTLTLEPLPAAEDPDREDDYFRLRAKILPLRKNKLTWSNWAKTAVSPAAQATETARSIPQRQMSMASSVISPLTRSTTASSTATSGTATTLTLLPTDQSIPPASTTDASNSTTTATDTPSSTSRPNEAPSTLPPPSTPPKRWTSTVPLWLTLPMTPLPSPSFATSYLTHLYYLSLTLRFNISSSSSSGISLNSKYSTVEFSIPLQIRYELDMAPGYEVDESLPEYEWGTGPVDEEDRPRDAQTDGVDLGEGQDAGRVSDGHGMRRARSTSGDVNGNLDGLPGYADATTTTTTTATETGATTPTMSSHVPHDGYHNATAGAASAASTAPSAPTFPIHRDASSQPQASAPAPARWTVSPPAVASSEVLSTEDDELINALMRRTRPVGPSASLSTAAGSGTTNVENAISRGGAAAAGGRRRYGSDD